jgi:serine/threonine protein phosphatase 1
VVVARDSSFKQFQEGSASLPPFVCSLVRYNDVFARAGDASDGGIAVSPCVVAVSPLVGQAMPPRTIAISDIHGCLAALDTLLEWIGPGPQDTIVGLGDYVDRGPDSRGVLERLMMLERQTRLVPLLGNHDEMMLSACEGWTDLLVDWLLFGGEATLASYNTSVATDVARDFPAHLDFIRRCRLVYETDRHFFVHGSYVAGLSLDRQPRETLLWTTLKNGPPGPHGSGKTAIVGHTAQKSGEILDLGYLKCIDTWCYGNGWLTALEPESGQVWQVDKKGRRKGVSGR